MSEITFLKTRHVYDSYADFWSLVSLGNFPTIYVDEWRPTMEGVFITAPVNGDYREHMKNHLDKLHAVDGIEEMQADEALGMRDETGEFVDRQGRGIGGDDGAWLAHFP